MYVCIHSYTQTPNPWRLVAQVPVSANPLTNAIAKT